MTYYWSQIRQAWAKRRKDTAFRTDPFIDLILASTALPYQAKILCVGPRNAGELDAWRRRGYRNLTGLDLLPIRDPDAHVGDMHRMPFADASFDVVYCSHVLEHSFDGRRALAEVSRVVRPGGWLFAAFPVNFTPNAHDRTDFKDLEGFFRYLPTDRGPMWFRKIWARETPTEVAVLARLEGK